MLMKLRELNFGWNVAFIFQTRRKFRIQDGLILGYSRREKMQTAIRYDSQFGVLCQQRYSIADVNRLKSSARN